MGLYTYEDFTKYTKFRMGQRTDLSSVDDEDLYGLWVNAAYKELTSKNGLFGIKGFHKRIYFPELETADTSQSTTDGRAYINTPTRALIIREVEDTTNDRMLEPISWSKYKENTGRADSDSEGQPTRYTRRGGYIYLHPTPDDAYDITIDHRKKITSDISGTTTTEIGEEWDEPILQLATYKGFMWMNDFEKATPVKAEFMETVADLLGIYFQGDVGKITYMYRDPAYGKK